MTSDKTRPAGDKIGLFIHLAALFPSVSLGSPRQTVSSDLDNKAIRKALLLYQEITNGQTIDPGTIKSADRLSRGRHYRFPEQVERGI